MSAATNQYLTVSEAADLLRVSASTVRRWIKDGTLVAHRVGSRRVLLTRDDLAKAVSQVQSEPVDADQKDAGRRQRSNPMVSDRIAELSKQRLTEAEKQRGLDALRRLEELNTELRARTGRDRYSPSWLLINEAREERTRQLLGDGQDGEAGA
jgi:excisionase family DNA binding protein